MFKKLISLSAAAIIFASSFNVAEVNAQTITPEQKAVIESFEEGKLMNEETLKESTSLLRATAYRTRWYLERGSVLAWSKDYLEWTYNGSSVSNGDAWQESGYIFPNIVRTNGIVQTGATTSTKYEYRASKTIGAGVVTPWGDVTVYESDITDYLTGDKNGNFSTY